MCAIYVICLYASRFRLGWAHDLISFACYMFIYSHAYILSIQYIFIYLNYLGLFWLSSFSFLLSNYISLLLWHPNVNMLCPGTFFVQGHPLLLTLLLSLSGSVMRRLDWTSLRTSLDEAFIRNVKWSCQTSLTLTFPLSFTIGNGGHCVTSRSPVHPCWFRIFTPTCMDLIFQYLISLLVFEVHALLSHFVSQGRASWIPWLWSS